MKTTCINYSNVEVKTCNYRVIKCQRVDGTMIYIKESDIWLLHPGYIEPTYLNSTAELDCYITEKWIELTQGNPYPDHGASRSLCEEHYCWKYNHLYPFKAWVINLLNEIENNGGILMYNHPKYAANILSTTLYRLHDSIDTIRHRSIHKILSMDELQELLNEYKLMDDYPKTTYPTIEEVLQFTNK